MSVIIDPRRHDAVLFDLDAVLGAEGGASDSALTLVRRLRDVGVGTGAFSSDRDCRAVLTAAGISDLFAAQADGMADGMVEAAHRLAVRPGRCAVVATDAAGVKAGRDAGFALVIAVAPTQRHDELQGAGADTAVADLRQVGVRTGDRRMAQLPDALQALAGPTGIGARRPAVFFDFD
ncbi:MAG: trehalose phosphatase, partial [Mycobacterium sp.]